MLDLAALNRTLLVLATQLILGALVVGAGSLLLRGLHRGARVRLRTVAVWVRAARTLAVAASIAVIAETLMLAFGVATLSLQHLLLTVAATPATGGCWLILRAGALEACGLRGAARRQTRLGGSLMALSALAVLLLAALSSWTHSARVWAPQFALHSTPVLPAALGAIVLACLLGWLAGLAGKPRPSGYGVAFLYFSGLAALIVATPASPPAPSLFVRLLVPG